jgi:hypothetical protein
MRTQAYIGGIYRDQGAKVASDWLISLLQPHVEDAYRSVLEDHLRPPDTPRQLETPDSLLFASASESSKSASPALPSLFEGGARDHRQLLTQANVLRQTDKPRVRLRRQRSSSTNGGSEVSRSCLFKPGSQFVVRHAGYYFQDGDIIFRVRGSVKNAVLTLDTDTSTGGRYPISGASLLLYARVGILSHHALPPAVPATPRRIPKRFLR